MVTPTVVERDPMTVVGFMTHFDGDESVFEALWGKFGERWKEFEEFSDSEEAYGIATNFVPEPMSFDYLVGVPTSDLAAVPEEFEVVEVPGGEYARFETSLSQFEADHEAVLSEWLPDSDYEPRDGPELERYGPEFDPEETDAAYEFFIPVVERTE